MTLIIQQTKEKGTSIPPCQDRPGEKAHHLGTRHIAAMEQSHARFVNARLPGGILQHGQIRSRIVSHVPHGFAFISWPFQFRHERFFDIWL